MADIQTPRFGRLSQALFNLKQSLTLGEAMPDALPVYSLTQREPDFEVHAGVDLCRARITTPAVAGQGGWAILLNPAGSGKIVVVDEVNVASAGTTLVYMVMGGGGGAAATLPSFTDYRRALQGRPTTQLQFQNTAVSIAAVAMSAARVLANTTLTIPGPIVLTPGGSFTVEATTFNQIHDFAFRFRERVMDPGELLI